MIFKSQNQLKDRITDLTGIKTIGPVKIYEDTSSYMSIYRGTVLRLAGNDYFVLGDTREGRFGIDDQPKFWVKYAVDLTTGERKVIKFVFHESINIKLGGLLIKGYRNPDKESAVLEVTKGHQNYMQGTNIKDNQGENIRIIDFIRGKTLFNYVVGISKDHEEYFFVDLPWIMSNILKSIEAMKFLHSQGLHHGDIRNDHIIIEEGSKTFKWIDFDVMVNYGDFDIWSMGNILIYSVGKGIRTYKDVVKNPEKYPLFASDHLVPEDSSQFYPYRLANLKKIFPYIPRELNDILMHFSAGAEDFYENFDEMINDLKETFSICWPDYKIAD